MLGPIQCGEVDSVVSTSAEVCYQRDSTKICTHSNSMCHIHRRDCDAKGMEVVDDMPTWMIQSQGIQSAGQRIRLWWTLSIVIGVVTTRITGRTLTPTVTEPKLGSRVGVSCEREIQVVLLEVVKEKCSSMDHWYDFRRINWSRGTLMPTEMWIVEIISQMLDILDSESNYIVGSTKR